VDPDPNPGGAKTGGSGFGSGFATLPEKVTVLSLFSGIQKKLDKGLRPGTVTQGVLSMTRKVQLVTNKLDQAHGKAREIEAIVIASIAFDNRYCHALTLNRCVRNLPLFSTGWCFCWVQINFFLRQSWIRSQSPPFQNDKYFLAENVSFVRLMNDPELVQVQKLTEMLDSDQ
jgi:hypothetical protein